MWLRARQARSLEGATAVAPSAKSKIVQAVPSLGHRVVWSRHGGGVRTTKYQKDGYLLLVGRYYQPSAHADPSGPQTRIRSWGMYVRVRSTSIDREAADGAHAAPYRVCITALQFVVRLYPRLPSRPDACDVIPAQPTRRRRMARALRDCYRDVVPEVNKRPLPKRTTSSSRRLRRLRSRHGVGLGKANSSATLD